MVSMKKTEMKVPQGINIASWAAIVIAAFCAFFATYYYQFSSPVIAMIWVGWLIATGFFAYFTNTGREVFEFAKTSKIELQKVVWPSRQETVQTTSIVMIMVAITGLVLWGVDASMMWAIGKITHLG